MADEVGRLKSELEFLRAANKSLLERLDSASLMPGSILREVKCHRRDLELKRREFKSLAALLTSITESVRDIMIVTDLDGRVLGASKSALAFFGVPLEGLIGVDVDRLLDPEDLARLRPRLAQRQTDRPLIHELIRAEQTFEEEVVLRPLAPTPSPYSEYADAPRRSCHLLHGTLLHDRAGGEEGVILVASDISNVKQREQRARQDDVEKALAVLHDAIGNISQGLSMYDADLKLLVCNRQFLDLLDFPESLSAVGTPFEDFARYNAERGEYGPGDIDELVRVRVLQAHRFEPHRFERQRPDGSFIEVSGRPLPNGGFISTYTDISERKRSENALRHAKDELELRVAERTVELSEANARLREMGEMKSDFMTTVAHELRTPLTSISALSEMLHDDPKMRLADRRRFLEVIVSEAGRLTRLINEFLDLAKLESGRVEWSAANVDLEQIVRKSAIALSQLFRDRACRLELDLPQGPWPVLSDSDRLMQVVINLLSNAVKFVPDENGCVTVSAQLSASEIRVEVADNGPGVPSEDREAIFEKFHQAGQRGEAAKPQGTGLGLPISRQIIEHFGGRLWLHSSSQHGAVFIFTLPLVPA